MITEMVKSLIDRIPQPLTPPKRTSELLAKTPDHPHKLQIHPTNRCNLKCKSCSRWLDEPDEERELSSSKWREVVQEAIDLGISKLNIEGGGEPLIRKELVLKLMQIAKRRNEGIMGSMITNGTLVGDKIAKEMVRLKWDTLTLSVDAPRKEMQDRLRGVEGTFDKNLSALKRVNKSKEAFNSSKPSIWFSTVISNENYRLIPELIDLAGSRGVEGIILHSLNTDYEGAKKLTLSSTGWQYLSNNLPHWSRQADGRGVQLKYDDQFVSNKAKNKGQVQESKSRGICPEPWYNLLINANGFASCCCFAQGIEKESVKEKDLKDVWQGEFLASVRRRWLEGKPPSFCEECNMSHLRERKQILKALREGR